MKGIWPLFMAKKLMERNDAIQIKDAKFNSLKAFKFLKQEIYFIKISHKIKYSKFNGLKAFKILKQENYFK